MKKISKGTRGTRIVEGMEVPTLSCVIREANALKVEVGTNGYHGGDYGHGGRTYFRISNGASTDMQAHSSCILNEEYVEVELYGDSELSTIITALKYIIWVLEEQTNDVEVCEVGEL